MMHFGSTDREAELPEEVKLAKRVRDATATIAGCSAELQIQKQQIKHQQEQLDALRGLVMTLRGEVEQIRQQHHIQLAAVLNGGPTER